MGTIAQDVTPQVGLFPCELPWLTKFFGKLVLDILPAALASVIGGFLFTQYQSGHTALRPATEQAAPASAEMMQIVRDEHAMIVDYLKTQMAAQQNRHAIEDEETARAVADAKAAADAKLAASMAATRRLAHVAMAPKPMAQRSRALAVASPSIPVHAPLLIAQAQPSDATPVEAPPRQPESLLAKTLDIKDHVVDGALQVVNAIGGIPSWIASMGDRIGGGHATSDPTPRQFSAAS